MDTLNGLQNIDATRQDSKAFDNLHLRTLLDTVQGTLAIETGLSTNSFHASRAWRYALSEATSDAERLVKAIDLMRNHQERKGPAWLELMNDGEAMKLLSGGKPEVRIQGDKAAHPTTDSAGPISRVQPRSEKQALQSSTNFVSSYSVSYNDS